MMQRIYGTAWFTKEELEALKELVELYPDTFFQGTPSMEKKLATNVLKNL